MARKTRREVYAGSKGIIRKQPFEISIPDEFNAHKVRPSPEQGYSYFLLPTRIGVTEYGKNPIDNIHYELRLESVDLTNPQITITGVAPTDSIRDVGTVSTVRNISNSEDASVSADFGADLLKLLHLGAEANITKKTDS